MNKSAIAEVWLALCGTLFLVAVCVFIALERWGWLDTIQFTIDGWTYAWGG